MKIMLLLALLVIILSIGLSACGPKPDGGGEIPIKMEYGMLGNDLPQFASFPAERIQYLSARAL